jgi:hypothetical protein
MVHWIRLLTTYDFERVGDDAHRLQLLSVVAAVHHQRAGQSLDDWALRRQ